ncbi:MAG: SagB family peptide dehydrogenase [Gammaproteobacteria bacterium]|nr:SagB family peptide dehydrogenase [Gammaproteobacteria bacterium]
MTVFITDLMKQAQVTVRVRRGVSLTPVDGANEVDIAHDLSAAGGDGNGGDGFRNTIPVSLSLKRALVWLNEMGDGGDDAGGDGGGDDAGDGGGDSGDSAVPLRDFRDALAGVDSHFGLLQTAALLFNNILTLGIATPRGRALADIEFSHAGRELPDVSAPPGLTDATKLTLSRFAYLHREEDELLLSRPLKDKRFVIRDSAAGKLLVDLGRGMTVRAIRDQCDRANAGDDNGDDLFAGIATLLNLLYREQFIIDAAVDSTRLPTRLEEGDAAMQQWDFHDALSHAHSRLGYNFGFDFGGAFPFVDIIAPRPAVKELPAGERIALYQPDLQRMAATDKRLTAVVIQRMSVRAYNEDAPVSLKQLGEFLFRTGRLLFETETRVSNLRAPAKQTGMGLAWRPYPTGGASYELEFYLSVDRAQDLAPGIYYYAPAAHALVKLSGRNQYTEGLIQTAFDSCARIARPQVVVHIAARFQRVSWKYHNIAYATMLRNAGVVYQTFYLHAVAMGLAGCGLGAGNTDLFCRATGNQPHIECNIGEFMLGSLPADFDYNAIDLETCAAMHEARLSPTAS